MKTILIIYHSQSGKVKALSKAARDGATGIDNIRVLYKTAFEVDIELLLAANGLIICSPENFGYMAGAIKDFFDRLYYSTQEEGFSIPYTLIIGAGNNGQGAAHAIHTIAKGIPFRKTLDDLIVNTTLKDEHLMQAKEQGATFAIGIEMGIF